MRDVHETYVRSLAFKVIPKSPSKEGMEEGFRLIYDENILVATYYASRQVEGRPFTLTHS